MECLEERERVCRYCTVCNQISVWHEAQQLLANYLSGVSLQKIADKTGLRAELADRGLQLEKLPSSNEALISSDRALSW